MSKSVWNSAEIANYAQAALDMAIAANGGNSPEFVRGVFVGLAVLCKGMGVPVPRLPRLTTVEVINSIGRDLMR